MRYQEKTPIILFVILIVVAVWFVVIIYNATAHAVEPRAHEQFKVSPKDITNTRVLVEQRQDQMRQVVKTVYEYNLGLFADCLAYTEPEAVETYYVSDTQDYTSSSETRYTEYYPSENTGAFAYAPDLEITLGYDGTYRDKDGYVVVAGNRNQYSAFDEVDTPYGKGKVYDTGCSYGIVDVYREG